MRRRTKRLALKAVSVVLAFAMYLTPVVPVLAQDPVPSDWDRAAPAPGPSVSDSAAWSGEPPIDDRLFDGADLGDAVDPETARGLREAADASGAPPDAVPLALPGGEARSAVTPQAISLPSAEGSIEGMGESFSPVLSSGTGTFSVPIALPPGRAGVQPSLALSYGTSGGNGPVGIGWSVAAPFIARQTDKGLPRYVDGSAWHPEEDRFLYNGGQELVPVDSTAMSAVDGYGASVPAELTGWQQYRARVEGAFMRFFRSPDGTRWVVQSKDGTRFDFGALPAGDGPTSMALDSLYSLQSELGAGAGRIYAWFLTRMSDAHGSTVYYRYDEDDGHPYLRDIHYVSPASCAGGSPAAQRACAEPLSSYGARVAFAYQGRQDVTTSYASGWRVSCARRLLRITVTAADDTAGARYLVRRYHLGYEPSSWHSLLTSVQVEGRPDGLDSSAQVYVGDALVAESSLGDRIVGRLLPSMRFHYTHPIPTGASIPGFGGIVQTVRDVANSPPHSVDEGRSDLFDVNSDGLPDLIVTDPARYRTVSGEPAVGVFFNGFRGSDAAPAASAATFSDAVPMPMRSSLSGVLSLSNLNVVPMDIDGDGRSDLLHMPRRTTYGWFTPTRAAEGLTPEVSPARQGWRWTYAEIDLPRDVTDPRIDLTRDSDRIRALDVNNDHLVDIVRTTGTVMQTWLNLGHLPGGEGRFGSAVYTGGAWQLSPDPLESCLLHDGLPVDFADPEVKLADMNGDGIQDIVKMRRGRVVWWPGRGLGLWGEGPARCERGEGAGRGIVMETPPAELNPELTGVYLTDVNADGIADVVQVRYDAVDVWFNRGGASFTPRLITRGTPHAPDFSNRIRFADIDGSGTADIVWGNAGRWQYVDPMGGVKPRLLVGVDNGLGAFTTLEYESSADHYLRDLREAAACASSGCEVFSWQRSAGACDQVLTRLSGECAYRSGGSPVVSTVVSAVETTDRFREMGREENVSRTEYAYHDGYYEGIEQEFRGFGAADAIAIGDSRHPTSLTRTYFYQGRRPNELATNRLADNPLESLKGRAYLTETRDLGAMFLSSTHSAYTVRRLITGLDGRGVWYAFVHQTDDLRYDVAGWAPGSGLVDVEEALRFETVPAGGGTATTDSVEPGALAVRGAGWAHLRSTTDAVDHVGNVLEQTAHGRIRGEHGETGLTEDIVSHVTPALCNADQWIWRTERTLVTGHGDSTALGDTTHTYDATTCNPLKTTVAAIIPAAFEFAGDSEGAEGFTQANQSLVTSTTFDSWGNALEACAGADLDSEAETACFRYATVEYDSAYHQLPASESIATTYDTSFAFLTTTATWDRGLGVLRSTTDANGQTTFVGYDGLGRMTFLRPPVVAGCANTVPTHRFEYELVPDGRPVSVIKSWQELSCSAIGTTTITSRSYVDGLGRARAAVVHAEGTDTWEKAGVVTFTPRGTPSLGYQPVFLSVSDPTPAAAVALPSAPFTEVRHDAFGREVMTIAEDSAAYHTRYHALSSDAWDPLDLDCASDFKDTPAITRTDGHGRVIDQVLINRQPGSSTDDFYRLYTAYRADGAVVAIARAETASAAYDASVVSSRETARLFTYDTAGRRIASTDSDTDSPSGSKTAANRTWRYLFNKVGDLVAVRDPRGCGQNFYYDRAGRLVAEAYVECGEAQVSGDEPDEEVPQGSVALAVVSSSVDGDVLHYFDGEDPGWSGFPTRPTSADAGRLTATTDRGQRTLLAYDPRGNPTWQARQMAFLAGPASISTSLTDPPSVQTGDAPTRATRVFDEDNTYVLTTEYDHGSRPTWTTFPADPDWDDDGGMNPGPPTVRGRAEYNTRGLVHRTRAEIGSTDYWVRNATDFNAARLPTRIELDDGQGGARTRTDQRFAYDLRLRMTRTWLTRASTGGTAPDLSAVTRPLDQHYAWDAANNLVEVLDDRLHDEWPAGHRPQRATIAHDALYRVAQVEYDYKHGTTSWSTQDDATDWRGARSFHKSADPMQEEPAPLLGTLPDDRVVSLVYEHDWLANMTEWTDDASAFYERSIGVITNGFEEEKRPSALYLSTNLPASAPSYSATEERGGWVELDYGEGGNVVAMTVHARCKDVDETDVCWDDATESADDRRTHLRASCVCLAEQHYQYRWDELNRIAEARRYDREGTGDWSLAVRQRYRYDGANVRTHKETFADGGSDRTVLYAYPGAFERSGVERDITNTKYATHSTHNTEVQYLIAGARVVWKKSPTPYDLEKDVRLTYALGDLLGSTSAVVDIWSGELLEVATWYPNGAQETLRNQQDEAIQPEPLGFTGKEADDEVGIVYFGERYLIPRIGRWASPDPLHIHAVGGGEALNSYHYVSGNLLQARDPVGHDAVIQVRRGSDGAEERTIQIGVLVVAGDRRSVNDPTLRSVNDKDLAQAAKEMRAAMEQSYVGFERDGVRYRFEITVEVSNDATPVHNPSNRSLGAATSGTRTAASALREAQGRGLQNVAIINPTLGVQNPVATRASGTIPRDQPEGGMLTMPADTTIVSRDAPPRTYAHEGLHFLGVGHLPDFGNVTDDEEQRLAADRVSNPAAQVPSGDARPLSAADMDRIHQAAEAALSAQTATVDLPASEIRGERQ